MKKNVIAAQSNFYGMRRFIILFTIFLIHFSSSAQEIILKQTVRFCAGNTVAVACDVVGDFNSSNTFSIEFYNTEGVIYSGQASIKDYEMSFFIPDNLEGVNCKFRVRSSSPSMVFAERNAYIVGKPEISPIDESPYLNSKIKKYEAVDVTFTANSLFEPYLVYYSDGTSKASLDKRFITVDNNMAYGIDSIVHSCGTTGSYYLPVKVTDYHFDIVVENSSFCSGNKSAVKILSDAVFSPSDIDYLLLEKEEDEYSLSYQLIDEILLFDIPEELESGVFNLKVGMSTFNEVVEQKINVVKTPKYSLDTTVNVLLGNDVILENLRIDELGSFDQTKTQLFLNDQLEFNTYNTNDIRISNIRESKYYELTKAYNECFLRVEGGVQVNVLPTIIIDSVSDKRICEGENLFFYCHSNVPLASNLTYKIGFNYTDHDNFPTNIYDLDIEWVSDGVFKLNPSQYANLGKRTAMHPNIYTTSGIKGKPFTENVGILKAPSINILRHEGYGAAIRTGTVTLYSESNDLPEGNMLMSDGKTVELRTSGGRILSVLRPEYEGNYYPVKTFNKCGENFSNSGGVNIQWTDESVPAILLSWIEREFYETGDTLFLNWETYGTFGGSNAFYADFLNFSDDVLVHSIPIIAGQDFVVIPNLGEEYYSYVRIRASAPSTVSTQRLVGYVKIPNPIDTKIMARQSEFDSRSFYLPDTAYLDSYTKTDLLLTKSDGLSSADSYGLFELYNTDNKRISLGKGLSFSKDSLIKAAYLKTKNGVWPFEDSIQIIHKPFRFKLKSYETFCSNSYSYVSLDYFLHGDVPSNLDLKIKIRKKYESAEFILVDQVSVYERKMVFKVPFSSVEQGLYDIIVYDAISGVSSENEHFHPWLNHIIGSPTFSVDSNLGRDIVSNEERVNIKLQPSYDESFNFYWLSNIDNLYSSAYTQEISSNQLVYGIVGFTKCGYVNSPDTVKLEFLPSILEMYSVELPCVGQSEPMEILYRKRSKTIDPNTEWTFYLKLGETEIDLYSIDSISSNVIGYHKLDLPLGLGEGTYQLRYRSTQPFYDKYLSTITLSKQPEAELISSTIYKYHEDLYHLPLRLSGGSGNYTLKFSNSGFQENLDPLFPFFEIASTYFYSEGYFSVHPTLAFEGAHEVEITGFTTSGGGCEGVSSGLINVLYLNDDKKLYANIINDNDDVQILCQSGDTLTLELVLEGNFGISNFVPQLSNGLGTNYTNVPFTASGNIYEVYLPENLPAGEAYYFRFHETITDIYGASSDKQIVIKENPSLSISLATSIVEGDSALLSLSFIGERPFSFLLGNEGFESEWNASSYKTYLSPTASTQYVLNNYSDKYCSVDLEERFTLKVLCKELDEIRNIVGENQLYRANRLVISSVQDSNTTLELNAGRNIIIEPGFETKTNAIFKAVISGCEEN
ncbi:3-coathanger stack domain-containing protein [Arcticibacterium luteifluviistationis]|nr:3-coathanger stack domain-containing protein [Arcticibacterium luteifluviistationis]